jgi:hypothetical protein
VIAALAMLAACGGSPGDSAVDPCAEAPVVTWETFGKGFLRENCQGCHASTVTDRAGAPVDVTFDDEAQALAWRERILARAATDVPTMPPQGGTTDDDRWRLAIWLTCGGR